MRLGLSVVSWGFGAREEKSLFRAFVVGFFEIRWWNKGRK